MELISVVVPIYNAEKYLVRCIDSIRNQTYTNLEIILVDDGSPDRCPQMCDEMMASDHRIKVIHKKNAGQGLARNDGMAIATGKYITFVDSDDWISLTHIENLYHALVSNAADAALGNHTRVTAKGEEILRILPLQEGVYEGEQIVDELMLPLIGSPAESSRDILINSSVSMNLYSVDLIRRANIHFISERFAVAEDFYFNVDFFHYASRVVFIKETGYFYFENMESTCEKYNPLRFERTLNYYTTICDRVEKYGLKEKTGYRIERSFLMKIRVAIRHIVRSDLSRAEKFRQVENILSNQTVHEVLMRYPIEHYIPSMRILAKLMRKQNVWGVYYLMRFREKARHGKTMKTALRWIGIGK